MRVSELAAATGVSVPTIKFYLREGLLPPGERTSATRARYGPDHVARLRVVRALTEVGGLSLATTRRLLEVLEGGDVLQALGAAQDALPPDVAPDVDTGAAEAAVRRLGWQVHPGSRALRQLAVAMDAVEAAGLPLTADRLAVYGDAAGRVADHDIAGVPTTGAADAVTYAVLGTVLYEPVLEALRRVAHADRSGRAEAGPPDPGDGESPVTAR